MAHPPNTTAQEDLQEFFAYLRDWVDKKERYFARREKDLEEREQDVERREAALTGNGT